MKLTPILATVAALAAGAAIVAAVFWYVRGGQQDDAFANCRESTIAGGLGSIGGPFTLVDENGKTVTDKDVITKPTLLYFGYTYCPDVCPLDNARNAEAVDVLAKDGFDVRPVFITIDPARDTPEVVKEFTDYMHPDMLGLTGTPEQIKAAASEYRAYYRKNGDDPADYLMDHSTFTYLVLPKYGVVDFFRRDATAEQMAKRTECFIEAAR